MQTTKQKDLDVEEEVFSEIISDKEHLRKTCLKLVERGYMTTLDYIKWCEANKLQIF